MFDGVRVKLFTVKGSELGIARSSRKGHPTSGELLEFFESIPGLKLPSK
jgi:hypothetical protein